MERLLTLDGEGSPIKTVDGKVSFQTTTPGEYQVQVFSTTNSKVSASATITVGAATLTGLTVEQPETLVTEAGKRFNNEEVIIATIAPNEGAALTPDNLKFHVTTTSTELTAADVKVSSEKKTVGTGDSATEVIVIKAKTSKTGSFTVTPYVGESFEAEGAITGSSVSFSTVVNPTVAEINVSSFANKELKANAKNVRAEIVFKNKHGETLTAAQVADNNTETYTSSNGSVTGAVTVVDGVEENAGKTFVNLADLKEGTALVNVQVGNLIKTVQVKVVPSVLTTINAGEDVTGVVAGDGVAFAKYNDIKFLEQDSIDLGEGNATVTVRKEGATEDTIASKLVELGMISYDEQGEFIEFVSENVSKYNAIKILPAGDLAEGTYTVTVSNTTTVDGQEKTISDSFNVTVGAARALTSVEVSSDVTKLSVDGTTKVLVAPKDQYNHIVKLPVEEGTNVTNAITLSENAIISASDFTAKYDEKGNLLGYEATIAGESKGTVNAEFAVITGSGETAVTKKATKSFTVDAVGNLASSVTVANPGLLQASTLSAGKQLKAVVKDASGDVINLAAGDLKWTAKDVVVKNANGDVISDSEIADVELSVSGELSVTGTLAGVATISLKAEAQTANLKVGSTVIEMSNEAPKLAGDLLVVSSVANKVLDADENKAGIQISLDGDDKDGETIATGTISVKLEGNDQYGNKNINLDESIAVLTTSDKTVATIAYSDNDTDGKTDDAIVITPRSVGTTQVYIQFGGKAVALDVTVTENNAAIVKAAN